MILFDLDMTVTRNAHNGSPQTLYDCRISVIAWKTKLLFFLNKVNI